jgi:hypothetical protein
LAMHSDSVHSTASIVVLVPPTKVSYGNDSQKRKQKD